MRILFIVLTIIISIDSYSQSVLNYDTYEPNDTDLKEVFDTLNLHIAKRYDLQVVGTYSAWSPNYWSANCGEVENSPLYPSASGYSTGNVGYDFEYVFSYPSYSLCNGASFPFPSLRFEISLDNGLTWFHPLTSEEYTTSHVYNYQITGAGYPLGIRQNSPYNSDDYGVLQFSIGQDNSVGIYENQEVSEPLLVYPNPSSDKISFSGDFSAEAT